MYKFIGMVAVQATPSHIPYMGYALFEGPKGGKLLVDQFNLEVKIKEECTKQHILGAYFEHQCYMRLPKFAQDTGKISFIKCLDCSDEALRNIAKSLGAKYLIRRQPKDQEIRDKLDISELMQVIKNYLSSRY